RAARPAHAHIDSLDLAESATADEFDGEREFAEDAGALLTAGLQHALVLAHGFDAELRLADGQREWLLAIHVFARLARFDDQSGVPVIWRGDDDGVDIFARDDLPEIIARID